MNRKMTALALAGNIGFLGAIGLVNLTFAWCGASAASSGSLWRSPVRPKAPNPAPASQRSSRRVRRQNWCALSCMAKASVGVQVILLRDRVLLREVLAVFRPVGASILPIVQEDDAAGPVGANRGLGAVAAELSLVRRREDARPEDVTHGTVHGGRADPLAGDEHAAVAALRLV